MGECIICCEKFNLTIRKKIKCNFCDVEICLKCNKRYLLGINEESHCMSCKNKWDRKYLNSILPKNFITKDLAKVKKKFLFDNEKSRFPDTMPFVINYLKIPDMDKEICGIQKICNNILKEYYSLRKDSRTLNKSIYSLTELDSKLNTLKDQIEKTKKDKLEIDKKANNTINKYWYNNRQIHNIRYNIKRFKKALPPTNGEKVTEKRKFIQKCQKENCRGFLSSQWKCAICKEWTCSKCFEVLGIDKSIEHTCKHENLESAKLIKKETRPCPKCATPIFKISGCDQMFCVQCKTPFSWNSGRIINGVIHNPHFFQWQRENGGTGPINPHAHCGGLPRYWDFYRHLRSHVTGRDINIRDYSLIFENFLHFQNTLLIPLRNKLQREQDNKILRMLYLAGEKTEKNFKTTLIKRFNKRNKEKETLDVWTLLATVFIENINSMMNLVYSKDIIQRLETCHRVREYVNKELNTISKTYSQVVKIFDSKFNLN